MKKTLTAILLVVLYTCFSTAQKPNISFLNLSVKDGLSQNTIIRIYQDSKDYMWFCTRDGLNKYDGTGFEIFRNIPKDSTSISSSDITTITETGDGYLWIGTHYGLNRMNPITKKVTRYYPDSSSKNSISDYIIKHLYVDSKDRLWIATTSGLDIYDKEHDCFHHIFQGNPIIWLTEDSYSNLCFTDGNMLYFYNFVSKEITSYPYTEKDNIYHIYEDSKKNLWIGTTYSGLKRFDRPTQRFITIDLGIHNKINFNNEQIGYIIEDESCNLVLASRSGILIYNSTLNQCMAHIVQTGETGSLSDNTVIALYKDRNENIWAGTWIGGVDYYSHFSNYFQFHVARKDIKRPVHSYNSFIEWNNRLWIGTNDGLVEYDKEQESYIFHSNKLVNPAQNEEVKYIQLVEDRDLYISIFGGNLYTLQTKGRLKKTLQQYNGAYLRDLEQDSTGTIWLASHTNEYLTCFNPPTNLYTNKFPVKGEKQPRQFVNVQDLLIDSDSIIWIGTRNNGLYQYNYINHDIKQYQAGLQNGSLTSNNVSVLFKDSNNELWVGTYGEGVCRYNRTTELFDVFDERNGLSNKAVCGILEDNAGNIWLTTQGSISCLNIEDYSFINYTHANGLPLQEINMHACLKTTDGTFVVGGSNGFISFRPQHLKKNPHIPKIVITDFKIWNNSFPQYDTPIHQIETDNKIYLKYDQSQFSVSYAALNYIFPHTNQYAYQLEGFDKGWNYVNNITTANYTNIPPGKYKFRVKGSNNDGIWNEAGTSFTIIITPPFWATWWAYTIYTILGLLLLWFIFNYFITKERLENNLRIKQIEQQNLEENHQLRIRLFTNFSHELRTPLTLIIGPLNSLLSDSSIPSRIVDSLNIVQKNANRLLLLVNQLMDFRKLESGNLKLKVETGNFKQFIDEIFIAFHELAKQRNIKLHLNYAVDNPPLWYNSDQLEKVLFNLLSNAFRHTRNNGEITIDIRQWELPAAINKYGKRFDNLPANVKQIVEIKVRDTGHGIAAEDLNKIFDPFYQANNYETNTVYGTGIGLNLTKGIIELHKGTIWAESKEGEGAIFRIFLPLGDEHLNEGDKITLSKEKITENIELIQPNLLSNVENSSSSEKKKETSKRYTVLIIEDNQDIRFYIKSQIKHKFNIKEAENGLNGKDIALHTIPDLIVCDIMMPGMNGIDVCKILKEDIRTSHIPIILLTARITIPQIQEGLQYGADDYITKPFNAELLLTRIENLIMNREKLRKAFSRKITVEDKSIAGEPSIDERFLMKVHNYIMENIDDPELRIEDLAEKIGMSRTQLYRKIKAITDMSPQKLVLSIRLKTAATCLKDEGLNVSETCARVGFSDPSYFSKRFKAFFNISPSEYEEKNRNVT